MVGDATSTGSGPPDALCWDIYLVRLQCRAGGGAGGAGAMLVLVVGAGAADILS